MTIWDNLLAESQSLEDLARQIQDDENIGLSEKEIENLSYEYQVWFGKCLSVLPEDLKTKFRAEYEGSFWNAKIKKFFQAATQKNPLRQNDVATQQSLFRQNDIVTRELFPYWTYPFKQNFHPHIQSQQQLLIEARERPNNAALSEMVTEDDILSTSARAFDEELTKARVDIQAIRNEDKLIQEVLRPIFEFLAFKGINVLHHSGTPEHGRDIVFYEMDYLDSFVFYAVVVCNAKIHTNSSKTSDSGHYDKIIDQVKKCYYEHWRDDNLKREAYIDKVIIATSSTITDSAIAYFRSWEQKERRHLIFLDGNRLAGLLARLRLSR